ncbi:hypothetical protein NM688_g9322 [Phlebia brevispora]|uniref:Uncharacterized protein n=1 Tax=Phlebia brevispora TaxID=194682 RepID=A0ACC1RIV8_9APHY|nr:hypothetical protein NM688_g9322 [Phlebia brevispora]
MDASLLTVFAQMFPPKPKWTVEQIPDLAGKVCVVTGGNTGIGKETCKQLLKHGATVYLAARSQSKAEKAIEDLQKETGKEARFLQLDLGDLSAVKQSAEEFKSHETRLDILFLNAGVMVPPIDQLTAQGYDMQFGVNVLGHFLFLKLLYPLLSSSSSPGSPSRFVWTTSSVNWYFHAPMKYDTLKDSPARRKLGPSELYCQSKFATVLLVLYLAKTCAKDGIVAITVDPGNIQTDLQRYTSGVFSKLLHWLLLYPTPFGAISQLYAGTAPEAAEYNGRYLRPWARLGEPHKGTKDTKEQEKMWTYCEGEVKPYL